MKNKIFSKIFLQSLFWKQNKHHKHGVFIHTIRVVYYTTKHKDWKLISAAIFHDIGKPFVAYQKDKDIENNEFSFTDHEEISYQINKLLRPKGTEFSDRLTKKLGSKTCL